MVCHSLLQCTTLCQISSPWPARLGLPHRHGLVSLSSTSCGPSVIRLTSSLWVWFQCVCLLMPLATPTILLGFLLPWAWGISSRLSSKAQLLLLTLDEGYLLTAALPDLQRGIALLGPPEPVQPRLLGRGVGPPGHCPWPRAWVAPPGRRPWPWTRGNSSRRYPWPRMRGSSSRPFLHAQSILCASS